ncbi:hypothetical protein DSM106972_056420 [Dulcicalothrix desertica PCC 7102]|uniref:ASCH domain-containing protein n=1 Tax=Dulcicalothrix desertica PCC 7102 TaxID=232991 RepID=A0A433V9C8_9CYAN|nr:ASCH domain-containing protein [Dulcicalothrix desertica]RUT02722.1 hypothetical protein DSM106972_056420 [Dulcicalothrix desertica PCC 7102]TWH39043.1 ASCH domain-containing protein [Dulcicalothrix desertica PCC 7102]
MSLTQDTEIRGLSIAGCYALLIAEGTKTIELRVWQEKTYRGLVMLHCSSGSGYDFSYEHWEISKDECPKSSIIGVATLVDCIKYDTAKKWDADREKFQWDISYKQALEEYQGKPIYGHVFENPCVFDPPILNIKGTFRYWEPKTDPQIEAAEQVKFLISNI